MTKRRICHIITKLELGGAQQNTLHTVTHLDRSRFETMLVTGSEGILVDEAKSSEVRTVFLPGLVREISPWRDLRTATALIALLRRERPDVVHTHSSKAGILGRFAAVVAGVPAIVHSIHGWGFHPGQSAPRRALYVAAERLASHATSAFIGVSRANLEEGEHLRILRPGQFRLIRSGIRLEQFAPASGNGAEPPPWPTAPDDGPTVGMVACFKPQKAPADFVEVAAAVLRSEPRTRFVLVGDGELRGAVEERIDAAGIAGRVALVGWRRDIPALMRAFDVLLHTSRWEGLPRVFPEAMATGLPIVATRVDGAPEAVEEGVNGRLLEPGDIDGMAAALVDLIRSPGERRRMGEAGLKRVPEWDIDRMVRDQEDLYDDLLAGRAPADPPGADRPEREEVAE
jgi:glycosyltransferase involved in cell wall biosynthesis